MKRLTPSDFDEILEDIYKNIGKSYELTEESLLANAILVANRLRIEIDDLKDALKRKKTIDSNDMLIVSATLKQMCKDVEEISSRYFLK